MADFPDIPGYKVVNVLGQGGAATVYLGIQEKLDRKVAIKILQPSLLKSNEVVKNFIKVAKTAASLSHSNIIQIYDSGKTGDYHYIVMQYLEESLKDRLERNPGRKMPPESALSIVEKIMKALDYAHLKGIYHRDIKPENIMFRHDTTPVLVDFGIARLYDSPDELTRSGTPIFTVFYYSPEECRSKQVDGRNDIYSLGVILYEMLTGEKPYKSESLISVALKHIEAPVPKLPMELSLYQPLIDKMMAKDKEERLASYPEFEQLLNKIMDKHELSLKMPLKLEALPKKENRQRFHRLYSVIRWLDSSDLKEDYIKSGKIIILDLNKGKILEKKPLFTLGRDLRYYWVSTGNKAENKAECVIKDQLKDQQVIVKIWYEVECKPQKEEKVVLALSKKNKPDEALNELIEIGFRILLLKKEKKV